MIGPIGIHGAVKVATMLTFPPSHVVEANSNELMRLIGRRRRRGIIAAWSAGETFIGLDERQGIAGILGPLGGIVFESSFARRLQYSI